MVVWYQVVVMCPLNKILRNEGQGLHFQRVMMVREQAVVMCPVSLIMWMGCLYTTSVYICLHLFTYLLLSTYICPDPVLSVPE